MRRTQLDRIESKVDQLLKGEKIIMAMTADEARRLDAATTNIARRLKQLQDAVAAGDPLTPEQSAQVEADIAALEAMGKDPNNPIPPVS